MIELTNTMKVLLSLPIGVVAAIVAKYVHPDWSIIQILIFGLVVFAVTAAVALIVSR